MGLALRVPGKGMHLCCKWGFGQQVDVDRHSAAASGASTKVNAPSDYLNVYSFERSVVRSSSEKSYIPGTVVDPNCSLRTPMSPAEHYRVCYSLRPHCALLHVSQQPLQSPHLLCSGTYVRLPRAPAALRRTKPVVLSELAIVPRIGMVGI